MALTNPQKAILHVAKAKLGWDDDTHRQVLVRIAGVTTLKDLDQPGFEPVMGFADWCGFRPLGKGAPRYGDRPGDDATMRRCDDATLSGWLLKYHKVHSMRFLTMDGARKAITALKAWKARPKIRAA